MQTEGAEGYHFQPCQVSTQVAPGGTLSEQSFTTHLWASRDPSSVKMNFMFFSKALMLAIYTWLFLGIFSSQFLDIHRSPTIIIFTIPLFQVE